MVASFDLFFLLVETIFGNILFTGVALAAGIWLIGMWTKMAPVTLIILTGTFIMAYSIGYVGGLAALLWGIIGIVYLFYGFQNMIKSQGT